MVRHDHVARIVDAFRELADEGAGKTARTRIAGAALESVDVNANPELARDLLADELAPVLVDLLAEVARLEAEGANTDTDAEGLLWLDLALVRVLERLDADEAARAREHRKAKGTDPGLRWALWTDTVTPLGVVRLAGVVWSRRVRERWRRESAPPAAIVRAVAEPLLRLGRTVTLDEGSGEVRDGKGERIAGLNPKREVAAVDLEVMRRGLEVFRSTLARRAFKFLKHEAHRAEVRGDHRPEIVLVDGGLVGFAERIGCSSKADAERVRDLLDAGRLLDLSTPWLEVHGLWIWNAVSAAARYSRGRQGPGVARGLDVGGMHGQRAVLEVVLNHRVFLSGAAESMKETGANTREARRARLLVPIPEHDPPYRVPNRAEWGRVWSVADAALVLLVDNGAELTREGGARIDSKTWGRLVADAGLDAGRVSTVRTMLLEGDAVSPPLLALVGADRFTLAPEHAAELAFIVSRVDAGKRGR